MPRTDAQKRAQNKYDAAHYKYLICKLSNVAADAFKEACAKAGTTPNAVFRKAIEDFMAAHREAATPNPPESTSDESGA